MSQGLDSDIHVVSAEARFHDIALEQPLTLAGGLVERFSLGLVRIRVADRRGHIASGEGSTILSVPWAWPRSALPPATRARVLRAVTTALAEAAGSLPAADPLRLWSGLESLVDPLLAQVARRHGVTEPIPVLAVRLALAAVDNAIHDAWGHAAGASTWEMYGTAHLAGDVASYLGPEFAGRHPAEVLAAPRDRLPVQHVLGVDEPMDALAVAVRRTGVRHLKAKLCDGDLVPQMERLVRAHRVLAEATGAGISISLDANEAFADPARLIEALDRLRRDHPEVWSVLAYLEQPTPRESGASVGELAARLPVLADEGLGGVEDLERLTAAGWSGFAVKAARGQSLALLTACWARRHGMLLAMQDLTAVDLALVHSARLASRLHPVRETFEYNSRQYAPRANDALAVIEPQLVAVTDGFVRPGRGQGIGLY